MIGLKEDKDLKNFSLIKNLNFPKVQLSLSELPRALLHIYFSFLINLLFSLLSASLPEFFLDKAGKN